MTSPQKKILIVLEAGDALPSGVVRGLIYKDLFAQKGYFVRYINRLPAGLVRFAQNNKLFLSKKIGNKNGGILKKMLNIFYFFLDQRIVRAAKGFDVVYFSKVRSHQLITEIRKKYSARLVYDFGDAIWLKTRPSNQLFEADKFEEILRSVHAVTTDNEYTASYARRFNSCVTPIPDCPQVEIFDLHRKDKINKDNAVVTIGWIGSPSTVYNLYVVWEALEAIFLKHKNVTLRLVGTGSNSQLLPQFENVTFSVLPNYSQADMVREVMAMDIGLFPLQNTEASMVRGVLKAAVYMSGGCAVVSSPVGQCASFIQDGINGFLAKDTAEWVEKIERLIVNAELRKNVAEAGLKTVRENFTLQNSFDELVQVMEGNLCNTKK